MIVYLTNIAHAFLPAAVVSGLLIALMAPAANRRLAISMVWTVGFAIVIGWIAYTSAVAYEAEVIVKFTLRLMALAAVAVAVVFAIVGLFTRGRQGLVASIAMVAVSAVLSMQGMYEAFSRSADHSFTATSVLNTELIANSAAVFIGGGVLIALVFFIAHTGRRVRVAASLGLIGVVGVLAAAWIGDVLLAALQLGTLGVTSARISFVAKATHYGAFATYALLALLALLAVASFWSRPSAKPQGSAWTGRAERRKEKAFALTEMRWLRATLAVATFLTASLLYYDLYASQPPSLSKAEAVVPDADGVIRISIDAVKDGKLHRFAYIAADGHRVRFFLINRYDEDHVKIGVVYDACMICGDDGYIQDGNDVICIACNVRVFVPSIGKPGGCNPIPMEHAVDGGDIVIAAAELERGARYFSEVVEITVTDPVTGNELINLKAPFQYDYRGNTFFFESKESYEMFKAEPEKYAGEVQDRVYRVQGHQTGG